MAHHPGIYFHFCRQQFARHSLRINIVLRRTILVNSNLSMGDQQEKSNSLISEFDVNSKHVQLRLIRSMYKNIRKVTINTVCLIHCLKKNMLFVYIVTERERERERERREFDMY